MWQLNTKRYSSKWGGFLLTNDYFNSQQNLTQSHIISTQSDVWEIWERHIFDVLHHINATLFPKLDNHKEKWLRNKMRKSGTKWAEHPYEFLPKKKGRKENL